MQPEIPHDDPAPGLGSSFNESDNQPGRTPSGKKKWIIAIAIAGGLIIIAGAVVAFALLNRKTADTEHQTIKIGFMGTRESEISGGIAMRRGIELAKKDLQTPNVTVEIVEKETKCDAESATKAMREFVAESAAAVIGEVCSDGTLAAAPIANDNKIPLISPSATSPQVTGAGDYIFRTIPSDALTGVFTAKVFNTKNYTRVAIMYADKDVYASGLRDSVKENVEKKGGTVVATEFFAPKATEVGAQMKRIKAANPDVLYIATGPEAPVSIFSDVKQLGLNIPVYGSESLQAQTFIDDAGDLANDLNIVTVNQGNEQFVEKYRATYGTDPEIYAAQAYDAYVAIARSINTGAKTGAQIKSALYGIEFEGVSGHIKFDKNGDVTTEHFIYVVKDRKVRPAES